MNLFIALCILCGCVAPHACRSVDARSLPAQDAEPFVARHHHEGNIAELLIPLLERSLAQTEASGERPHRRSKQAKKVIQVLPYRGSEEHKRKGWRKLNSRKKQVVEITPLHGKNGAKPLAYILSAAKPSHAEHAERNGDVSSISTSDLEHDKFSSEEQQSSEEDRPISESNDVSINALQTSSRSASSAQISENASSKSSNNQEDSEASKDTQNESASLDSVSEDTKSTSDDTLQSNEDNIVTFDKKIAKKKRRPHNIQENLTARIAQLLSTEEQGSTAEEDENNATITGEENNKNTAITADEDNKSSAGTVEESDKSAAITAEDEDKTKSITAEEDNKSVTITAEEDDKIAVVTPEEDNKSASATTEDDSKTEAITAEVHAKTAAEENDQSAASSFEEDDKTAAVTVDQNERTAAVPAEKSGKTAGVSAEEDDTTKVVSAEENNKSAADTAEEYGKTAAITTEVYDKTAPVTAVEYAKTEPDTAEEYDKTTTVIAKEENGITLEHSVEESTSEDKLKSESTRQHFGLVRNKQSSALSQINDLLGNLQTNDGTIENDASPERSHNAFIKNDIVISHGHRDESAEKSFSKLFNARARDIIELIQSSVEASTAPHRDCLTEADRQHHDHKSYRLSFLFNK